MGIMAIAAIYDSKGYKIGYRLFDTGNKTIKDVSIENIVQVCSELNIIIDNLTIRGNIILPKNIYMDRLPKIVGGKLVSNNTVLILNMVDGGNWCNVVDYSGKVNKLSKERIIEAISSGMVANAKLMVNGCSEDILHINGGRFTGYRIDKHKNIIKNHECNSANEIEKLNVKLAALGQPYRITNNFGIEITDKSITDLVINDIVKVISKDIFKGCNNLKYIKLSDSIEETNTLGFEHCKGLESVELPLKLKRISRRLFNNCASLMNVVIKNNVSSIDDEAFRYCVNLSQIILPESLKIIDSYSFIGCRKLSEVIIPDSVEFIGEKAFAFCTSLNKIVLPLNLREINKGLLLNCSNLRSVDIKHNVKNIGDRVFEMCMSLESIEIPEGVETIGKNCFAWCSRLKEVTLPSTIRSLGADIFKGCKALEVVRVSRKMFFDKNISRLKAKIITY